MTDRQPSIALIADPVAVKVGLVWVGGIGAIVDWASAYQSSKNIVSKFWIAKSVLVRVGTCVADIREAVCVCIQLAFRARWQHG